MRALALAMLVASTSALAHAQDYGARAQVRPENPVGVRELEAETAAKEPASLGEPARATLALPGVARSGFAGSELIVWGAAANETRVYVDGVEIPALFHPTGLRTTVHPALIRRVSLTPGAAPAEYGRGLGGAIEITTDAPREPGVHGALRADAIDTSLTVRGANEHVAAVAAVRQGYLDRLAERLWPEADEVLAVPSHRDAAAKLEVELGPGARGSATYLHSRDSTQLSRVQDDVSSQRNMEAGFDLVTLMLARRYGDAARTRISPFFVREQRRENSRYGPVPLSLAEETYSYGLRAEYVRSAEFYTLSVGFDGRGAHASLERSGTLTLPAREGDIDLFGAAPVDAVANDRWRVATWNLAPHVTLVLRAGDLRIAPGLRLETYYASASRSVPRTKGVPAVGTDRLDMYPEPRLDVGYRLSELCSLEARAGLHHQPAAASDRSAVFGAPELGAARALQAAAGTKLHLPIALELELVGFAKRLQDLPLRAAEPQPALAHALRREGHGSVYGGSLALTREVADGPFGALAYTLSQSRRIDPDGTERPFDADQPHVLSLLFGYAAADWNASTRLRAASGYPRTNVVSSYLDAKTGNVQPVFARHNQARTPGFFQMDLHAERHFTLRPLELALLLDIINLTNQQNVEEVAYTSDYAQRRDVRGLPFLAMVGVAVEL